MLFQPSDISPDVLNGTGCVDATAALKISWLLGGTSPLAAWKADIYEGTTLVRTTGKITLASPVWPLDPTGTPRRFEVTLTTVLNDKEKTDPPLSEGSTAGSELLAGGKQEPACDRAVARRVTFQGGGVSLISPAGAVQVFTSSLLNGHEYRLFITQWDTSDTQTAQTTPSVFLCRSAPVLTLSVPTTLASRKTTVTAAYSQAQNDSIAAMRWTASVGGVQIHDSGTITGAAEPKLTLDGLLPDTTCSVTLEITTESGASKTASASFPVSYPLSPRRGEIIAVSRDGRGCIEVSWTRYAAATSYSVFRRLGDAGSLEKVAECPATAGSLYDYGVLSGSTYTYYVYPSSASAYLTLPVVSDPVTAALTAFRLIEAEEGSDGVYTPLSVHLFTCSDGDPLPGGVSSSNSPAVHPGLSQYPVLLRSPSGYASGILSGYVSSTVPSPLCGAENSLKSRTPVFSGAALPLKQHAPAFQNSSLVLLTPSGEKYLVATSGPVIEQTNYKSSRMPVRLRIPWVETGTAPVSVAAPVSSGFIDVDGIIFSTFTVNPATGMLTETSDLTPHTSAVMTLLSLTADGILAAAEPSSTTPPAALTLDDEYNLIASVNNN